MKAHISGFAPELARALHEEAEKQCNDIIQEQSEDIMRRCMNLLMMSCANISLSPKTGQRIKADLDKDILPAWAYYAATGDGDDAIQSHLERMGWPYYETKRRM